MQNKKKKLRRSVVIVISLVVMLSAAILLTNPSLVQAVGGVLYLPIVSKSTSSTNASYVLIGWNDLGMHCYDRDYSEMAVLPPYNNIWAQLIKRGNEPEIVTSGVTVEYSFPDNTYSVGKTNFWDYAEKLFGVQLAPNIGLTGKGMAGKMDAAGDHFVAEGVPVTEYSDSNLNTPDYYQMARLVAKDNAGHILASTDIVVPISSEMRCDTCHNKPSATDFRKNILELHDSNEGTTLVNQMQQGNPVLCASCHADPALGAPGTQGVPSLSSAMHGKHDGKTNNCYSCHPGPETQCLRDVMSVEEGMTCTDCHPGGMAGLGNQNRTPWVDLPRCANCHDSQYHENQGKLYKVSTGHGGLYCESCHNSTHAILKSREPKDNQQSINLQGYAGTIEECTVCHLTKPDHDGPHE